MGQVVRMDSIDKEPLYPLFSMLAPSPMAQCNRVAVASRRLWLAWRRMLRNLLRDLLVDVESLNTLDVLDLADVLSLP